ncbi:ATP-binding protein [Skermanella rosea]|uniref:ATP-binding protein n=1 Tax=Skermanella rosea TaxID=1817965 RepID=UPI0019314C8D|nr:ATP-binding protein [Skermanella rosea]UEM03890.1 ATP-binding protein [Skermanella rosea]
MNDTSILDVDRPFWPGGGRDETLEQIRAALMRPHPLVLFTGAPEVGKSRLVRELAERQKAQGTVCAFMPPAMPPADIRPATDSERLLAALGTVAIAGAAAEELTRLANEFARRTSPPKGIRAPVPQALLIVDGADTLDGATLDRLAVLTREGPVALLLAGRTALVEALVRSAAKPVRGAVTARIHLDPLSDGAAGDFIAALVAARGEAADIAPGTVRRIVARSGGIPGEIERLTADAIMLARASRAVRVAAMAEPASDFPMFQPLDLAPVAPRPDPAHCIPASRRSMQEVFEDLRTQATTERRAKLPVDYDAPPDPTAWTLPCGGNRVQPEPPRGRTLPWATGIALAVIATAFIAPEPQYDVPTVHVSENPHAVIVSSVVPEGSSGMGVSKPAAMLAELEDEQPAQEPQPQADHSASDTVPEPVPPEEMPPEEIPADRPTLEEPALAEPALEDPLIELPSFDDPVIEPPSFEDLVEPFDSQPALTEPPPVPVPEEPAPAPVIVVEPPPAPPPETPSQPRIPAIAEKSLLERGHRLMALGDIASARLLFEMAASQGSARGALEVGRTLDPAHLHSLGARGVAGDPVAAAAWYRRAADLGEPAATALLDSLGRR